MALQLGQWKVHFDAGRAQGSEFWKIWSSRQSATSKKPLGFNSTSLNGSLSRVSISRKFTKIAVSLRCLLTHIHACIRIQKRWRPLITYFHHSRLFHFIKTTSSDRKGQNAIFLSMRHDVSPFPTFTAHFLAKRVEIRKRIHAQRLEGQAGRDEIRHTGDEETIIRRLSWAKCDRTAENAIRNSRGGCHKIAESKKKLVDEKKK